MSTYDDNLSSYKNTIGKLVSGELKVLAKDEPSLQQALESDFHVLGNVEKRFLMTLSKVVVQADIALERVLGDEQIWLTRSLSIVISLSELEKYPPLANYLDSEGFINIKHDHLPPPIDEVVAHILNIEAALCLFIRGENCAGKRVAMKALQASGHPIEFYSDDKIGPFGRTVFAKIPTKWGMIRVKHDR